jgi:16S rRNA (cytosine967-C5)-methyltransferase
LSVSTLKKINNIYKKILVKPKFDIAINILSYSREQIKNKLTNLNIKCKNTICSPYGITVEKRIPKNNLKKIKRNFFEVQDEGSQIMTMLTNITPGTKVLDFCAGKGTKTIFIKNTFLEKEDIYAYDIDLDRSNELKKRIKELNINNIKVLSKIFDTEKKFDVILCDVPCTGTGTWRRRPENIIRLKEGQLNELVKVQASILNDASRYCKNGGEIVYISCSLIYEENEGQIKKFLKANKEFKLINIRKRWETNFISKLDIEEKSWITLTPDTLETDGYFISILKKFK